jgi:hypothetical protein
MNAMFEELTESLQPKILMAQIFQSRLPDDNSSDNR